MTALTIVEHLQGRHARPKAWAYAVEEFKFDDFEYGNLIDTKGPGYASAVNTTDHFRIDINHEGVRGLIDQAIAQIQVAPQRTPIVWYVAELKTANAIGYLFHDNGIEGINVVYQP